MIAGEKSIGSNGLENFLFPLAYMYLTQGSYTSTYSHNKCYAMDFAGWGANGRILKCPYYAPFDCHCVAIWGSKSPMIVWESDNEVNFIDGTTGYACIGFVHDDDTESFNVGDTRSQGDVIGHTGTYGEATGDHVHIEAKKGIYEGYHKNSANVYMLTNSTWLYNLIGVNDTVIVKTTYKRKDGTTVRYSWNEFKDTPGPSPTPSYRKQTKFPWVLYANKIRAKLP